MNDLGRARRLLEDHRPAPGEVDLCVVGSGVTLAGSAGGRHIGELCRYSNSAHSVAYSPEGKVLAVAGLVAGVGRIWDVPDRKRIAFSE